MPVFLGQVREFLRNRFFKKRKIDETKDNSKLFCCCRAGFSFLLQSRGKRVGTLPQEGDMGFLGGCFRPISPSADCVQRFLVLFPLFPHPLLQAGLSLAVLPVLLTVGCAGVTLDGKMSLKFWFIPHFVTFPAFKRRFLDANDFRLFLCLFNVGKPVLGTF